MARMLEVLEDVGAGGAGVGLTGGSGRLESREVGSGCADWADWADCFMMGTLELEDRGAANRLWLGSLSLTPHQSGALSLVQIRPDTLLSLVEPFYAVAPLCYKDTAKGMK